MSQKSHSELRTPFTTLGGERSDKVTSLMPPPWGQAGVPLADAEPRVKSGGKLMGHIRLTGPADVDERAFRALVRLAVALNEKEGDPTHRSSGVLRRHGEMTRA